MSAELHDKDVLIAMFHELGSARRARSDAEHIFTGAAVASFGAIVLGVATVDLNGYLVNCTNPALLAVYGILATTVALTIKIVRDHYKFERIANEQADVALVLKKLSDGVPPLLTEKSVSRNGYLYTITFLFSSAFFSILLCVVILMTRQ